MEAIRLIKAAGARPKRSIVVILFAAEEIGLVGSQAWLKKHPEVQPKIVMMINRDGSPSAITGATVPETWYADFQNHRAAREPELRSGRSGSADDCRGPRRAPGGTDLRRSRCRASRRSTSTTTDATTSTPTPGTRLNDLYSELVPYTEHQQHSALVTAVVAYGAANLDKPLPRDGVYLADGLYADIAVRVGRGSEADHDHARLRQRAGRRRRTSSGSSKGSPKRQRARPRGQGAARAGRRPRSRRSAGSST